MKRSGVCSSLLTCLTLVLAVAVAAQESGQGGRIIPDLSAYRINGNPPEIDGKLTDPIWTSGQCAVVRAFIQLDPKEGTAPTESTLVAVAYDDAALYVAFWCYDSEPDKIGRQLVRRDRYAESDRVSVRIDPFHDHQSGNFFQLSASGVQVDGRQYNDNNSDESWDGVWESDVCPQPWGWSAEIRIPYYCLRFAEKDEHVWGLQLARYINRRNESDVWAFTPSSQGGFVSNFGHLNGLTGIKPTGHAEILPYAVSRQESEPKSIGNPDGRALLGNAGFDMKYALSSDLILDATVNPDFGQVELDQPVLNLSTYETMFPERRPFFLEGTDLFETEFTLFYSRRIGRPPQRGVSDPDYLYYADYPKSTTILGAAKMTGKLFRRTSIALLSVMTQEEMAKYAAGSSYVLDSTWAADTLTTNWVATDTLSRKGMVEPLANYTVVRVKQDILRNSSIGGLLTLTSQNSANPAVTGGIDWRLTTNDNAWVARGQAVFSRVGYKPAAGGFTTTFEKTGGKHIRGAIGFTAKDPNLRINRLGYTQRVDSRRAWAWMQYWTKGDWWIIRESYNNINYSSEWNYAGINYALEGNYNAFYLLRNYWGLGYGVEMQAERYSDLETRGNGLWAWPTYPTFSWWLDLSTDSRKKLSLHASRNGGGDRGGTWWSYHSGFDYRPRANVELSSCVTYYRSSRGTRWVQNVNDSSLFADLSQDQFTISAGASYVVNRNLSVQLSAQGLISGLDYEKYRYYLGGRDYSGPVTGFNDDGNFSALNSTFLVRWEYRPGSALYLVWTRARSEFDQAVNNVELNRDFDRFFSAGSQNLFLIKASYWLNI